MNKNLYRLSFFSLVAALMLSLTACRDDTAGEASTPTSNVASSSTSPANAPASATQGLAADAVRAEVAPIRLAPGAAGTASVRVVIASPFHVNANPATHSYLIPTQLSLRSFEAEGVMFSPPVYPVAVERKFAFDKSPLRVYEGTVEIKLSVRIGANAAPGERVFPARLRVQPCDDEVCYPPLVVSTEIPVSVIAGA